MKGTAILIKEDHIDSFLENVTKKEFDQYRIEDHPLKTQQEKEATFQYIWHEEDIDWDYGY